VVGSPTPADTEFVTSDTARRYVQSLPFSPSADLALLLPGADAQVRHECRVCACHAVGSRQRGISML